MPGSAIPGFDAEYLDLVRTFPPQVIHSEVLLDATQQRLDELLALQERSPAQDAYLDLLSTLVEDWETNNVDIPSAPAIEVVKFLCEMHGTTQRALVPIFGTPSIVSEVLSGKRELQRKHIEGLAAFFHVSPAAFFPAPALADPPDRVDRRESPRSARSAAPTLAAASASSR